MSEKITWFTVCKDRCIAMYNAIDVLWYQTVLKATVLFDTSTGRCVALLKNIHNVITLSASGPIKISAIGSSKQT